MAYLIKFHNPCACYLRVVCVSKLLIVFFGLLSNSMKSFVFLLFLRSYTGFIHHAPPIHFYWIKMHSYWWIRSIHRCLVLSVIPTASSSELVLHGDVSAFDLVTLLRQKIFFPKNPAHFYFKFFGFLSTVSKSYILNQLKIWLISLQLTNEVLLLHVKLNCVTCNCKTTAYESRDRADEWIWQTNHAEGNTYIINTQTFCFHGKVLITRMQRQSKAIHQHSQICLLWHLWIVFFILSITSSPNLCSGAYTNMCLWCETWSSYYHCLVGHPQQLVLTHPPAHTSVLAAIESTAQDCRWRMSQIVTKRQVFQGFERADWDVGRVTCHRHESHVFSC